MSHKIFSPRYYDVTRAEILFHRNFLVIAKVYAFWQMGDVCTYKLAVESVNPVGICTIGNGCGGDACGLNRLDYEDTF